jgi:hypothetical protein
MLSNTVTQAVAAPVTTCSAPSATPRKCMHCRLNFGCDNNGEKSLCSECSHPSCQADFTALVSHGYCPECGPIVAEQFNLEMRQLRLAS